MQAFDALYEARDSIRTVHARHEQATTFMADGYAKATGKVGVAMVVPGPGALFAAAGLGTAFASSSPVVLIAGQVPSDADGKRLGYLHEMDEQLNSLSPLTKWGRRVENVAEIPRLLHEALRQAKSGRPRPVQLEISPDKLSETGDVVLLSPESYSPARPDPKEVGRAAEVLSTAKRVAIIAGGGVTISGASDALLKVAEFLQAAVVTTEDSKGVIPDNHDLAGGAHYSGGGFAYEILPECDVVLAVGTRMLLNEYETFNFAEGARLVQIDIDPREIGKNYPVDAGVLGDADLALSGLFEALQHSTKPFESRREEISERRTEFQTGVRAKAPEQTQMVDAVRSVLDEDSVLVSDMTIVGYWAHLMYPVQRPRRYLTPGYFGTLGFAFPTALGAKVARPDAQVVALCGDGGFLYAASELATAVRHNINAVAVVFNNNAFGASWWDQATRFNGRHVGTELTNPDFVKLAESFGAVGMRTEPEKLVETLERALAADAPTLVEVPVPVLAPPF